jgi:hypothetical protein
MRQRDGCVIGSAAFVAVMLVWLTRPGLAIESGHVTGVVRSEKGAEAGVWVIAETADLPTKLTRIVVTADTGRFLIPDLPAATYKVWVRGYGLVDSKPVSAAPGQTLNLTAAVAATARAAAVIYPADYWYSLIRPPSSREFPGTGAGGNGIAEDLPTQAHWIDAQKQGCMLCHQLGNRATREIQKPHPSETTLGAWDRRVQQGLRSSMMNGAMSRFGRQRGLQMFADWTDRIGAGEVPTAPPRPKGIERNVVLTLWEWGAAEGFVYNATASDKRNPRVNANAPVYGVDTQTDMLTMLDPTRNQSAHLRVPTRIAPGSGRGGTYGLAAPHYPAMDEHRRTWFTTRVRSGRAPEWCKDHESGKYFLPQRGGMQAAYYDPETQQYELFDTCYGTHHLNFAEDANDTLYLSGSEVIGWIDTATFDKTRDERISQGWCPLVLDTNGDGTITKPWNESSREGPIDPTRDTRIDIGTYAVVADPTNAKTVWISSHQFPGRLVRVSIGERPPASCIAEVYEVPSVLDAAVPPVQTGFGPRGVDIDGNGVVWTALSGSGHFASFDRRRCKVLDGPAAVNGRHCVAGWKLYPMPGPVMAGTNPPVRADYHHYNWVDEWDTLGLGKNIPVAAGSNSDSLLALIPGSGEWIVLRVPYPLGFFTRGFSGRIDDPAAGWKGRGVWATYSAEASAHIEGGSGVKPGLVKFQVRPDPLAE